MKNKLIKLIKSRGVKVGVIGMGYVGLPLAVGFAEKNINVIGLEIDSRKIDAIKSAKDTISGITPDRILKSCSGIDPKLEITTDYDHLEKVDVVIICVPTPLKDDMTPDLSFIESTAMEISHRLREGMLIVLESTTYPGTTEELLSPIFESTRPLGNALKPGSDYFLAFSPERIDPGRTDYTIKNTPKIVGGITENCTEVAAELYKILVDRVVTVSSAKTAEMVKLLENTYRLVNIGLANEFALICDALEVDVWEVIDAAATKPFGYTAFYPGPGLGGHCIPVDPLYLSWKLSQIEHESKFINLATEINQNMCGYVVSKIEEALKTNGKRMENAKILVLGVAYKPDVSDVRESPGIRLISSLIEAKTEVSYHDMFVPEINLEDECMFSVELTKQSLSSADCVVITTGHSYYPIDMIIDSSSIIVDTRNAAKKYQGEPQNVIKI
ncbi:MAG: UDP-N-acetyl-D-glucosamine dehydrogenase [Chloroflexi bacterium]|nr:MAG: UDP-N-acetyl-D-glucosamine dehydrogenase [Chloroflexota bacterium]